MRPQNGDWMKFLSEQESMIQAVDRLQYNKENLTYVHEQKAKFKL